MEADNYMENNAKIGAHVFKDSDGNLVVKRFGSKMNSQGIGNSFDFEVKFLPKGSSVVAKLQGWSCLPDYKKEDEEKTISIFEFNKFVEEYNLIEQEKNTIEKLDKKITLSEKILSSIFGISPSKLERKLHNL